MGRHLQQVHNFKYLGSNLARNVRIERDGIQRRAGNDGVFKCVVKNRVFGLCVKGCAIIIIIILKKMAPQA